MIGLYLTLIESENDKERFTLLYNKYKVLMFYVANNLLNNEQKAEDAVQNSLLRIAQNFHKIGDIDCPQTRAFVVIITKNIAKDIIKKDSKVVEQTSLEGNENITSDVDKAFENITYNELKASISTLNEDYKTILFLYGIYGYNTREIANLLHISIDSAKKRLQRARAELKKIIEKGDKLL